MTFPFPAFCPKVAVIPSTAWLFSGYNAANKMMAHVVTPSGFGTGYSQAGASMSAPRGVAVTSDATAAAAGDFSQGFCGAPFTPGSGWGSSFSRPGWPGGSGNHGRIAMHPSDGAVVKGAASASPYIFGCPFNKVTGFGSAYSAPGTVPGSGIVAAQFTPAGHLILSNGANLYGYQFSTVTGYGTAYSSVSRTIDGDSLLVKDAGGGLGAYYGSGGDIRYTPFDPSTGFGTEVTGAGSIYSGYCYSVCIDPSNANVFALSGTTPFVYGAPLTAGVAGTKYSNPSAVFNDPPTGSSGITTPINNAVFFCGGNNSTITQANALGGIPYTTGSGFGTKFSAPASMGGNNSGDPRALGVAGAISYP